MRAHRFQELLDESTGPPVHLRGTLLRGAVRAHDPTRSRRFMVERFYEVLNDCALRKEVKHHKDRQVREAVILLLPRLVLLPLLLPGVLVVQLVGAERGVWQPW